ncbi:NACHT domain-containing protein [Ditylenchus destructor]|uniref:NACHT domain-containing protein n=1 Tax=Ditylenchus destructor TaxID=166010 RepID=A0AAD4N7G1_9BILA|nr:NACHT domain-containing protein [Ditylenchus destructor]
MSTVKNSANDDALAENPEVRNDAKKKHDMEISSSLKSDTESFAAKKVTAKVKIEEAKQIFHKKKATLSGVTVRKKQNSKATVLNESPRKAQLKTEKQPKPKSLTGIKKKKKSATVPNLPSSGFNNVQTSTAKSGNNAQTEQPAGTNDELVEATVSIKKKKRDQAVTRKRPVPPALPPSLKSVRKLALIRENGETNGQSASVPTAAEFVDGLVKKEEPVDQVVAKTFGRVFAGRFDDIPAPLSKLVRVFTSSTFTDTTLERNALMEDVYPDLKRYCRETHGLDFQVVDMRWGVRDEATDDHMTTNLCINEIKNCQRLSMGANFVIFLCQKYGYRPLPSEVLSSELEVLKRILKEQQQADVSVLDTWYIEDLNAVPSQFILQPISSILVNFNNKRIPKLQEQDARTWWEIEAKMQNLLRKGAKICHERGYFAYDQMHNYFMSVTEREVIQGILKAESPNEHCLCYVRHIKNINISQTSVAAKFIDIVHKQVNQEAQKLLANLRDERVPAKLRVQNIRRSTVEWVGREGMDTKAHVDYLREFCADFYSSVTSMVDHAMRKHAKYRDAFFAEILQHLWNGIQGSHLFFGRESELGLAKVYLKSDNAVPLIFYGDHGCGKTSILAMIATQARAWLKDEKVEEENDEESNENQTNASENDTEPVLILRFLGTSPDSSSIAPLLISVCEQIAYNYNINLRQQCPTEISKLFQHFKKMTTLATKEKPLIIVLDSLDLLSKMDASEELLWFPPTLPPNVKLIASLSSNTTVENNMHRLVESLDQYINVPPLGPELGMEVIRKWLQAIGRTLTSRQSDLMGKALSYCTLPLFLKLVYATVSRWKSYSKPQETVLFKSVQQSIHALFDRTENQHGKLLVSHALSYITAARSGISDSELEDLISLDDKVLDDIYQYHLPPVRRIPPLLWSRIRADLPGYLSERAADGVIVLNWYHEQFRTAANERYFKNLNHLQNTHSAIADYFLGIWGGVPKPYQYTDLQKQRFGVIENEGLADRKVPKQPNLFRSKDSDKIRYNTRKLNELPFHLLRARRLKELFTLCLFNFEFLQAKLCSFPLQLVVADYEDAISKIEDADTCRQLSLVVDALRLSASLLSRFPYMLAFELLGRLLPLVSSNGHLKTLLCGCDMEGPQFNCFLPAHHCFHSPGGPLKYSLEEHPFAVFGMALSSNQKNLASTSNQLIVWDVQTGDLTRIINPNIEGIFLGMALSSDDRLAVAYTNNNQVNKFIRTVGKLRVSHSDK